MALYVHYLYILGKIEKREYPPRMTPRMKKAVMKFEQYREQFAFLRDNGITTASQMDEFKYQTDSTISDLKKQRTILNVRKKKRKKLFAALTDVEALKPAKTSYEQGLSGMEDEFARYMQAVETLENCNIPKEQLLKEKAEIYNQLAEINRAIRAEQKKLTLCGDVEENAPKMKKDIQRINPTRENEVRRDERRRR